VNEIATQTLPMYLARTIGLYLCSGAGESFRFEGVLSYRWACGPPIDMKMRLSVCVCAEVAWTAKLVCTLDEVRPFLSLVGNARFDESHPFMQDLPN
jgi:hypothetical protein